MPKKKIAPTPLFERPELLRERVGLSQAEFARELGITTSAIQRYGQRGGITARTLERVGRRYDCSLDWLVLGTGQMVRMLPASDVDPDLSRITSWITTWWQTATERDRMALELDLERMWPEFKQWNRAHGVGVERTQKE